MKFATFCFLLIPVYAMASVPVARIEVSQETIAVGEKLELQVTLLTPTWFTSAPAFPSFEITNAIVRLPPDSSYPVSEVVEGQTWSGIRRHYEVMPLIPGEFELGNLSIPTSYADPATRAPIPVDVTIPAIRFSAVVPRGAELLSPYIAGNAFTVTRRIEGQLDALEVGGAVVIIYEASINGLPGMFIPELAPSFESGYSVYAAEPEIIDSETSQRRERVTLIARAEGNRSIPASRFSWWNFSTHQVETIDIAAINPAVSSNSPSENYGTARMQPFYVGVSFIIAAIMSIGFLIYRRKTITGEALAYRDLQRSLRSRDAPAAYRTLGDWLTTGCGQGIKSWLHTSNDPSLAKEVEALIDQLYGGAQHEVNYAVLARQIHKVRHRSNDGANQPLILPQLNPHP